MTKTEFIDKVADSSGLSKKDAKLAVDTVLQELENAMIAREDVVFVGFGSFVTSVRAARTAKVPGTDRIVDVPETIAVRFKTGKNLKTNVNKK